MKGGQYFLNFPLFTAEDVRQIRAVTERYSESLAKAMLARRPEINLALSAYDAPGVDRKALAFFVLGCASLNWDGLNVTAAKGYRKDSEERPDGKYVPDAEEITAQSLDRIYWGSHNDTYGNVFVTSFGDHASKRNSLPDLLRQLSGRTSVETYPEDLRPTIRSLMEASMDQTGAELARMMIVLRDGDRTSEELARASGLQPKEAGPLIKLLLAVQMISLQDGRYRTTAPVLTKRDEAMTKRVLAIGNQVMAEWLTANYAKMKSELQNLSFTRSGVPFEGGFTMTWHYLLGLTNRQLVEAGLFSDQYATDRKYKGLCVFLAIGGVFTPVTM